MHLLGADLATLSFVDIKAFLALELVETVRHDYKHAFPNDGYSLAKTMAAFANTMGGVLLIGVGQKPDGKPSEVVGVAGTPNELKEKVEQIALRHIFPGVPIEVTAVAIPAGERGAGAHVVIVRVHESPQAPHAMVNDNAIYVRTDDISHPEKYPELRWLEHLLERRGAKEAARERMFEDAAARFAGRHEVRAAPNAWLFLFQAAPTYPHLPLVFEHDVPRLAAPLFFPLRPRPGGAFLEQARTFKTDDGSYGAFESVHVQAIGQVFYARTISLAPRHDEFGTLLTGVWQLAAALLARMHWAGHVSVRCELRRLLNRKLNELPGGPSAFDVVNADSTLLCADMRSASASLGDLFRSLLWGMGHESALTDEAARKWFHEMLREQWQEFRNRSDDLPLF